MTKAQPKPEPGVNVTCSPKVACFVRDQNGKYKAKNPLTAEQIIEFTKSLLADRFKPGQLFNSPDISREWLRLEYQDLGHEIFACLFLDNRNYLIAHEVLFRGTIDSASIYPREVAKRALQLNAAAVIFAHNHPSGDPEPSTTDKYITDKLKQALFLLDIRTLDHFIVGKQGSYSFAENGML
jgi:DNA repair protein RadC